MTTSATCPVHGDALRRRRVRAVYGLQSFPPDYDAAAHLRFLVYHELVGLHAFVMVFSHSRMPAVVWSECEDQVARLSCHNGAFRRLGGVAAVNRIDDVKTAIARGAGSWGSIRGALSPPVICSRIRQ